MLSSSLKAKKRMRTSPLSATLPILSTSCFSLFHLSVKVIKGPERSLAHEVLHGNKPALLPVIVLNLTVALYHEGQGKSLHEVNLKEQIGQKRDVSSCADDLQVSESDFLKDQPMVGEDVDVEVEVGFQVVDVSDL